MYMHMRMAIRAGECRRMLRCMWHASTIGSQRAWILDTCKLTGAARTVCRRSFGVAGNLATRPSFATRRLSMGKGGASNESNREELVRLHKVLQAEGIPGLRAELKARDEAAAKIAAVVRSNPKHKESVKAAARANTTSLEEWLQSTNESKTPASSGSLLSCGAARKKQPSFYDSDRYQFVPHWLSRSWHQFTVSAF